MTDLLEHDIMSTRARQLPDVGPAPPAETPPEAPPTTPTGGGAPWPRNAKVVVALLAIATLLAALATFVSTGSDDDEIADQQEQIDVLTAEQARLTAELESANARVESLTTQRDELNGRIAELDAQLATASAEVDPLIAERVTLMAERDELQASLVAAAAQVAQLETLLDMVSDQTATLDERLAVLDVRVSYLLDRAVTAEAERDALLDLFPIEFESSLWGVDLAGQWKLSWDQAYCSGFPTCGTNPAFTQLTITETPQRWLRARADGVFDAGLFSVEGALYGITESRTAAPACDGVQRPAHVGLTLYASDVSVADDGTHVIEDLGATYVVDAPATGTCPAGVAVYSAEVDPVG